MESRPTVFLDRDGVLLRPVPQLHRAREVELLPGSLAALSTLHQAGVQIVVLAHLPGVARGLVDVGHLSRIHQRIDELVEGVGVSIAGYFHCPHHPAVGAAPARRRCSCAPPTDGLLRRAEENLPIDWSRSAAVGDDRAMLGLFASRPLPFVLVSTGDGRRARAELAEEGVAPDLFCGHLSEAVPWLIRRCFPDNNHGAC